MVTALQLRVPIVLFFILFYPMMSITVMSARTTPVFATPAGSISPTTPFHDFVGVPWQSSMAESLFQPNLAESLFQTNLKHLGFYKLAVVITHLFDSSFSTWNDDPSTFFAPADASIQGWVSTSVTPIQGIFSFNYLRKPPFGTQIKTMSKIYLSILPNIDGFRSDIEVPYHAEPTDSPFRTKLETNFSVHDLLLVDSLNDEIKMDRLLMVTILTLAKIAKRLSIFTSIFAWIATATAMASKIFWFSMLSMVVQVLWIDDSQFSLHHIALTLFHGIQRVLSLVLPTVECGDDAHELCRRSFTCKARDQRFVYSISDRTSGQGFVTGFHGFLQGFVTSFHGFLSLAEQLPDRLLMDVDLVSIACKAREGLQGFVAPLLHRCCLFGDRMNNESVFTKLLSIFAWIEDSLLCNLSLALWLKFLAIFNLKNFVVDDAGGQALGMRSAYLKKLSAVLPMERAQKLFDEFCELFNEMSPRDSLVLML